ncbi:MAG: transporter substrate-binding domain-containing protein [Oscillospiraceae bacterium]|jgi:polar amino acid transport system substrate-binding protein|nr:transporter substrate-binding domain-containing protein [Oscillospiraceae bacterium]
MKKALSLALALVLALSLCSAAIAQGAGDLDYITGKGTLIVGMTLFPPMNYYDQATGEFVGFDTELASLVGEKLGVAIEFIEISWDAKEIELNSRNIDAIWNGMCITEERAANMSMSDPYLINTQVLVMKADNAEAILADINGKTVVAEAGSTGEGKLLGTVPDDETTIVSPVEFFKDVEYIPADSMAKAVLEVKAGAADAALVDSVAAIGIITPESDFTDLVINMDNNFGDQFYGIAFRKGSDVTAKVNEIIAGFIADGTFAELADKYNLSDAIIK